MNIYPSLYDRLKNQHTSIGIIISGVDKERLHLNPAPGKWSIHDNIAHLAKYQPVFIERMDQILKKENILFERYKAEDDPGFPDYQKKTTPDLLNMLSEERGKIFQMITHLNADELVRTGIHKKFGILTIVQWVDFFLLHEAHHIFTIFQLTNDTTIEHR